MIRPIDSWHFNAVVMRSTLKNIRNNKKFMKNVIIKIFKSYIWIYKRFSWFGVKEFEG